MKKEYRNPDADIVKFKVRDIVITSDGLGDGGAKGNGDFVEDVNTGESSQA